MKPKVKKSGDNWLVYGWHTKYFYIVKTWKEAIKAVEQIYKTRYLSSKY